MAFGESLFLLLGAQEDNDGGDWIDDETRRELDELRKRAFEYNSLPEFRGRANYEQVEIITEFIRKHVVPKPVLQQMARDVAIYNTYDALAMWLDSEHGLAAYYPELMLLGRELLNYAESRRIKR